MAIYLATTKSISRSDGRSAVASAAYRAGEKLQDARYGKVQNYSGRHGVMSTDIILPNTLKDKASIDRNSLWNMAEQAEKRKDSRVAREWLINLPHELDESIRQEMAHHFAQTLADRYGVIADCCIHRPSEDEIKRGADPRNFHAHIMFTTRQAQLSADGQITLGDKATVELSDTKRRSLGLDRVGAEITELRLLWEQIANEKLAEYGFELIDSRSYQSQGIDQLPQLKMGKNATRMERDGIKTPVGDINRLIKERNELVFNRELAHIAHTNNQAEHIIIESRQSKQKSLPTQKRTQKAIQPLQDNLATYVPATQEKTQKREISPPALMRQPLIRRHRLSLSKLIAVRQNLCHVMLYGNSRRAKVRVRIPRLALNRRLSLQHLLLPQCVLMNVERPGKLSRFVKNNNKSKKYSG